MDCDEDQKTIWCGNLSDKVTEEILYELFLQTGPVRRVKIPKDKHGKQMSYGFVTFKHVESVPYALSLIEGITLYDRTLVLKPRQRPECPEEKNMSLALGNHIINNHYMAKNFSPHNRKDIQNNYGYNDNYNESCRKYNMNHDRRSNHGGRFQNHDNRPYSHHKNDRRRNRH